MKISLKRQRVIMINNKNKMRTFIIIKYFAPIRNHMYNKIVDIESVIVFSTDLKKKLLISKILLVKEIN